MKTDTEKLDRKWFVRSIGVFCGAFVGLAMAALCIALLDAPTTFQSIVAVLIGVVSGTVVGFFFPQLAEFILRVAPDIFR